MKSIQQGFTLIELMIVIAIIAILAAIAIPTYQNYIVKSQVSEGMSLADAAKTAVVAFYSNRGRLPGSNQSAGITSATSITGNYVSKVNVGTKGAITITYNADSPQKANTAIDDATLELSPVTSVGSVRWTCKAPATGTVVKSKYLPSSCR